MTNQYSSHCIPVFFVDDDSDGSSSSLVNLMYLGFRMQVLWPQRRPIGPGHERVGL